MADPNFVIRPLAELEEALAAEVRSARAGDPLAPVTVLVGHVLLRPYLRRMLARRGVAHLNVRFVRPNELALAMSQDGAAADTRPRLSQAAERLMVREIAASARGYFAPVAGRDGFAEALTRLFRELELGGFTPDGFKAALGPATADAGTKEAELARLFGAYEERRGGFAAPADAYAAAMVAPFEGPLLVYGLWSPTELQARLIERIAGSAPVTVFLPAAAEGATGWVTRGSRWRIEAPGGPPAPGVAHGAVALTSAPDTVREVWEAARACLRWAEQGIAFHEMAVVYRNRDPYRALVDEVFSEARIPAYLHDGRPLSTHPVGRRLLLLLDLAADHDTFSRAKVMEFLTETDMPKATRDLYEGMRPSAWEGYSRQAAIIEGAEQWQARLARLIEETLAKSERDGLEWMRDVAARIAVLQRFAADFHAALAERPAEATWAEHLTYLSSMAARYAAGTEPVIEALGDLAALAAVRERVPFDVFCRAVRDDLESRDTSQVLGEPVRLFGREGVAVIDASSLRHLRFRAVYMLGVAERAWPPPARPDPLLLEHERRHINGQGAGSLPLRTEPDEETPGFWTGLQGATERLALSYARADAGRTGKHLPSYFFRAVAEAIEGKHLTLDELEASAAVTRVEAGRLAVARIAESLSVAEYDRGLLCAKDDAELAAGVAALAAGTPSFGRARRAHAARRSRQLTAYEGMLTGAAAEAAAARSPFAAGKAVSASRVESYATCPYQYFLANTLYIEPVKEPEAIDRLDPLQRGNLVHEILQRFLTALGPGDPPRAGRREAHIDLLMQVARECGATREQRGVTGRALLWAIDRQQIEEDLERWYDDEVREAAACDFRPAAFEARFGTLPYGDGDEDTTYSKDAPLELTVAGRSMKFRGRIDRIDLGGGRFRVIDYKTGKTKPKGVLRRGESMQLPIYMHAGAHLMGLPAERGEAQYYFVSSKGGFERFGITGEAFAGLQEQFERVLAVTADGMEQGFFPPNPSKEHCEYCDFKDICDARIIPLMEKKKGDERAAGYRALEDIE